MLNQWMSLILNKSLNCCHTKLLLLIFWVTLIILELNRALKMCGREGESWGFVQILFVIYDLTMACSPQPELAPLSAWCKPVCLELVGAALGDVAPPNLDVHVAIRSGKVVPFHEKKNIFVEIETINPIWKNTHLIKCNMQKLELDSYFILIKFYLNFWMTGYSAFLQQPIKESIEKMNSSTCPLVKGLFQGV